MSCPGCIFYLMTGRGEKASECRAGVKGEHARERLVNILLASALLSATLFFFTPSHLFFYNIDEFLFKYSEVILSLLLASVLSTILVIALTLPFFRLRVADRAVSFVFALAVLFWVQGNLFLWDYGNFDGGEIYWARKLNVGIVEMLTWGSVVSLALLLPRTVNRFVRKGCIFIAAIQLVSLCVVWLQTSAPLQAEFIINKDPEFKYSRNRNIVLLVLDAFNTDAFYEALGKDASIRDTLDGFTYFPNSVGGYPHTFPSIPLILTGRYFDNSLPRDKFMREAFLSGSVPLRLKQEGYHVYLPPVARIYLYDDIASNIQRKKHFLSLKLLDNPYLLEVSLFRSSPHFIKRVAFRKLHKKVALIELDRDSDGNYDLDFIRRMQVDSQVVFDKPVFKYYHIFGLHEPFLLNERLEEVNLPGDRSGQLVQAKALLKIVDIFLGVFKKLDIYGQTMFVIIGDHGKGNPEMPHQLAGDNMAYLAPLVLVKPFSSRGALKVSDAPVSLGDVPRTILSSVGLGQNTPGLSMLDIDPGIDRERKYYSYNWESNKGWNLMFYPPMKEYIISGDSWLEGSWKFSNKLYTESGVKELQNEYTYGSLITFGRKGNSMPYLKHGWAHASISGHATFTVGKRASLYLRVGEVDASMRLVAKITPYLGKGRLKEQRVVVRANGREVQRWSVSEAGEYEAVIAPDDLPESGELYVAFEMPDAVSPTELGISGGSPQKLGLIFEWVSISESR